MGNPEHLIAKCACCDVPIVLSASLLSSMRVPAIFCKTCWQNYDDLTLRQWFKLDMAIHHLHSLGGNRAAG